MYTAIAILDGVAIATDGIYSNLTEVYRLVVMEVFGIMIYLITISKFIQMSEKDN